MSFLKTHQIVPELTAQLKLMKPISRARKKLQQKFQDTKVNIYEAQGSGGLAWMLGCERNPGPYNLVESGPLLEKNRDLH